MKNENHEEKILVTFGEKQRYMTKVALEKHRHNYKNRGANLFNRLEIYMLPKEERKELLKILEILEDKTGYENDNVSALLDCLTSNFDSDGYVYIGRLK
ncbi:MAG: hypothetical protein FWE03_00310 [Firmicutes bacterium]|nr:hypothetical protein [Bacillota bacterium]